MENQYERYPDLQHHYPKRPVNLSINSNLLNEARKYKVNLSGLLEQVLIQKLTEKKRAEWLEENHESLEAYNQRIEERGIFSRT